MNGIKGKKESRQQELRRLQRDADIAEVYAQEIGEATNHYQALTHELNMNPAASVQQQV